MLFKQLYRLVSDNRLHAVIVIVGTAVTMTFVMAAVRRLSKAYAADMVGCEIARREGAFRHEG
ncbi:MAG TPA: hypothetical protein PK430_10355 [Muribaculum sp.]|jgi:hypothetical protein|uniref:ABC transporter permease n=1 Tax=Heminiphilus faecis TaxID=2601703 RepID=A0ABV4CVW3_9BACT|nr:hypothetical protein [Heminiphilus faecis]RLT75983.1 hypothetical protein D7V95_11025 [bacterium J10(2018)]HRF69603.1 hypothetical protein [Muribaculum sp.]